MVVCACAENKQACLHGNSCNAHVNLRDTPILNRKLSSRIIKVLLYNHRLLWYSNDTVTVEPWLSIQKMGVSPCALQLLLRRQVCLSRAHADVAHCCSIKWVDQSVVNLFDSLDCPSCCNQRLKREGYETWWRVHTIRVAQTGRGTLSSLQVLCKIL